MTLSESHRRMLYEESGIDPAVAQERGYYTARRGSEVPEAFKNYQRKPGLLVPMYSPDGETVGYQLRPDRPRKGGPKYETPGGISPVVDVHPRMLEEARHGTGPLLITEGAKTGDAATSRGICTVVLAGVWMWCVPKVKPYRLKPCFDHIRLEGRKVVVAFDSDCMSKASVQDALAALVAALEERGALVKVIYLPDAADGSGAKQGIDDYLASEAGGTIKEMFMLAREFNPAEVGRIRMGRDQKLRAAVEDLERRQAAADWTGPGGDADEDLYLTLAANAIKHGKIHADGIRVTVSWGTLALEARIGSSRTVGKGLARLEKRGLLYRDTESRKEGKPGAFVLKASARAGVKHKGESAAKEEKVTKSLRESYRSTLHPRSPRLRASRPKLKPTKKMIREYRLGTRSQLPEPREGLKRLGKKRSHAFDRLDAAGGTLTLGELGRLMGVRPRDLVRRKRAEKGRNGLLIWPDEAGIIRVDGDTVSLTPDWLDQLEEQRERGEEIEADGRAEEDRKRRNRAYREYLADCRRGRAAASKPSAAGLEAIRRSHEQREAGLAAIAERAAAAAKSEELRKAEAFVRNRLAELGRIRLSLLQDIWHDEGGDPWTIPQAVEALGCRVEELPEFDNRRFVFPPAERAA
jgi:hypothetical protein